MCGEGDDIMLLSVFVCLKGGEGQCLLCVL